MGNIKEKFVVLPIVPAFEISNKGRVRNIRTGKIRRLKKTSVLLFNVKDGKRYQVTIKKWVEILFPSKYKNVPVDIRSKEYFTEIPHLPEFFISSWARVYKRKTGTRVGSNNIRKHLRLTANKLTYYIDVYKLVRELFPDK